MTGSLQTKHGKYYVVVRVPDGLGNTKANKSKVDQYRYSNRG